MEILLTIFVVQNILGMMALIAWGIVKFVKYRKKKHHEKMMRIEASLARSRPKPKPILKNVVTYNSGDKEYKARFEDGVVYAMPEHVDDFVIGYYALEEGGWKVRCSFDKGEIATINKEETSATIFFNRIGDIARNKKILMELAEAGTFLTKEELERQHNESVRRTRLSYMCAEVFGGFIHDIDTNELVATSTSDDVIGNAAAFTCLQYNLVMEGKYHDFYSPIK